MLILVIYVHILNFRDFYKNHISITNDDASLNLLALCIFFMFGYYLNMINHKTPPAILFLITPFVFLIVNYFGYSLAYLNL